MPQFSDDIYLGGAVSTLLPNPSAQLPLGGRGFGPLGRVYLYDIVPLTLNAANIAASQSPAAGAIVLTAGTGVTAVVDAFGTTRYTLDVPRAIRYVSGSNDSGITFTATGYDFYGQSQTETVTGANAGTATGKKAFSSITGVVASGSVAGTLTIGTTDVLGLPVSILDAGYVQDVGWANALARDAGTFVVADATSPATATTGDVRGTYVPSSASNGTRRLVFAVGLTGIQVGPNATTAGLFGVTPV